MATLKEIDEKLQLERDLRETRERIHGREPMTTEERSLLTERLTELTRRKLELNPPPAGPSAAEVVASVARGERWREASSKYWVRRRELERELARTDPKFDAERHLALARELRELRPPDYQATE